MLMISLLETEKKKQHEHVHRMLGECLKKYGIDYNESTPVSFGEMGKPYLTENPGIHYNLSHADGIAVCFIAGNECGADCEKVRPYRPNVVKRAFSESEKKMLEETAENERDLMFFRLWTLKESYVKAIGTGISYPLAEVSFSFDGDNISCSKTDCFFRQYILKNGAYVVSLCCLAEC